MIFYPKLNTAFLQIKNGFLRIVAQALSDIYFLSKSKQRELITRRLHPNDSRCFLSFGTNLDNISQVTVDQFLDWALKYTRDRQTTLTQTFPQRNIDSLIPKPSERSKVKKCLTNSNELYRHTCFLSTDKKLTILATENSILKELYPRFTWKFGLGNNSPRDYNSSIRLLQLRDCTSIGPTINMLSRQPTEIEHSVLNKGLSLFLNCKLIYVGFYQDITCLFRRIHLTYLTMDAPADCHATNTPWSELLGHPEGRSQNGSIIKRHLDSCLCFIKNRKYCIIHQSLIDTQNNFLLYLKTDRSILIKQGDKCSASVVQDTLNYIVADETLRPLEDVTFKRHLTADPNVYLKDIIAPFPRDLLKTVSNLTSSNPTRGLFDTQPQMHVVKSLTPPTAQTSFPIKIPPGHPPVSDNGTLTKRTSLSPDENQQPIIKEIYNFFQDTCTYFLLQLSNLQNLRLIEPPLVTHQRLSLCNNAPHKDGVLTCKKCLQKGHILRYVSKSSLLIIVELNQNNLNLYIKSIGNIMGTMITPLYLNNFRTSLEEKVLNNCVHLRYIDDKFMVWVYGLLAYDMLVMKPNNFCPVIFTFEKSNSMISFFETFASVDWGRTLTSLYDHHTDNHTYLYCKNHHSHHIKESIVCSRCLRHMIICLFAICFLKQSLTLRVHSLDCGYHPNKFIPCKILANFLKIQRDRNLQYTSKPGSHHIPLALTHIGQMDPSLTSVKEASRLPRLDENVRGVFMHPPVTFRTKPITLRDRLVKRRLSSHVTTSGNIKCDGTFVSM
ncbi:uncharacterized protein [Apostichopus japonicus]|uniref:uncharacterized protein n=1 Tax=Stichopus japonicus TaxID=307972 RepID=UPI003AB71E0A